MKMAQQDILMMEAGPPLSTQISDIITRMQNCCAKLRRPCCFTWKGVGLMSLFLVVACVVVWGIFGVGALIFTMVVSIIILVWLVYRLCTYPRVSRMVGELEGLALRLRDKVKSLKSSLEPERPRVMLPFMSSRWNSLDELDVCSKEVVRLVSQMDVAMGDVNPRFISELKEKLQKCQQLLQNI